MQNATRHIQELTRRPSPAPRIQPLALHEGLLWMGSWDTHHIYGVDPQTWTVKEDVAAPGQPFGIAPLDGALHVVVSLGGDDDDRYLFRFDPGSGFDLGSETPCPDMTGSHLASDGRQLFLGQMHNRRIVTLDAKAQITSEIPLPTSCGGFGFGPDGTLYMIAADDDFEKLEIGTLDRSGKFDVLAPIDFGARSLVYDGSAWFTSDREAGFIVSFTL
ncbi:MAG TPA: hypothetical protein VFE36_02885 [Candidatus Baltobacteraceae bacterium]|nr:hypothetical protein [Candidatus Baltobacteraceae bacterium]